MSVSRDEPPAPASFEPLDSMKFIVEKFGREEAIRRWEMSRPVYNPPTEPIEREFDFDLGGIEFEHGTTTIGFIFNSDVMVAVDHTMISPDEFPENVIIFNPHLLVAYSGGCPASRDYLHHLSITKGDLSATELKEILVARFCSNPDSDNSLSLGILIAGWKAGLPYLYKVNGKGEFFEKLYLGTGSASFGAVMIGARRVGEPWGFSEAIKMATKALCFSVDSAPIRKEYVTVFHIGRSGITKTEVVNENIEEFQKRDLRERGLEWVDPNTIPRGYMF